VSIFHDLYLRYRTLVHEALKFCVVGGVGVIITDGGTNLLVAKNHMDWLVANVIATVVAIGFTYIGSRYWTFKHRERSANVTRETVLFYVLAVVGLIIQLLCLGFTTKVLGYKHGLAPNIALLGGICLATLFRFWSYRKWVFRAPLTTVLEDEHEALQAEEAGMSPSASGSAGGVRDDRRGQVR
jgi:putative flippase GtrA